MVGRAHADLTAQSALVPLFAGRRAEGGKATAYLCRAQTCELPTSDAAAVTAALGARRA